jgi:hypothetical protein
MRFFGYHQRFPPLCQTSALNTMVLLPDAPETALRQILAQPVSQRIISHLSEQAIQVVVQIPFPFPSSASQQSQVPVPFLSHFVTSVIKRSHVQMRTLMASLVYLRRLRSVLPPTARGLPCSAHKIFLTCLILAAKYVHDICPKNKHWVRYSVVPCCKTFGFTVSEINAVERELLCLLEWDLHIDMADLYDETRSLLSANYQREPKVDNRPEIITRVPRILALAVDRHQSMGRRPHMYYQKLCVMGKIDGIPSRTPQLNELISEIDTEPSTFGVNGTACGLVFL